MPGSVMGSAVYVCVGGKADALLCTLQQHCNVRPSLVCSTLSIPLTHTYTAPSQHQPPVLRYAVVCSSPPPPTPLQVYTAIYQELGTDVCVCVWVPSPFCHSFLYMSASPSHLFELMHKQLWGSALGKHLGEAYSPLAPWNCLLAHCFRCRCTPRSARSWMLGAACT